MLSEPCKHQQDDSAQTVLKSKRTIQSLGWQMRLCAGFYELVDDDLYDSDNSREARRAALRSEATTWAMVHARSLCGMSSNNAMTWRTIKMLNGEIGIYTSVSWFSNFCLDSVLLFGFSDFSYHSPVLRRSVYSRLGSSLSHSQ